MSKLEPIGLSIIYKPEKPKLIKKIDRIDKKQGLNVKNRKLREWLA